MLVIYMFIILMVKFFVISVMVIEAVKNKPMMS